jgi:hypothetical protein
MLTVQGCWTRYGREFGLGALMLWLAPGACVAASTAAVSGVVRDARGVAQMGAMVQVLAADSVTVKTAFTDMYGRYRIANLVPGKYQVEATGALFVPAIRANLRLATGMLATVNLTLNMFGDPAAWLPAERRRPDEPGDDWTWTLRSAVNRPILRILGDGEAVVVSSDAERPGGAGGPKAVETRAAVAAGGGGFGGGGVHTVVMLDRAGVGGSGSESGRDVMVRADVAEMGAGVGAGGEVGAGYETRGAFGGGSRVVVSYQSHPEMMSAGGAMGLHAMRVASAKRMKLGDAVDVEAGGTVYAIHTAGGAAAGSAVAGSALTAEPFLRVAVHPGEVWAVKYRLATSRDVQGFDGLDSIAAELPMAAMSGGRLCAESGSHNEIAVSRKAGAGLVQAAVYRDAVARPGIAGVGAMGAADVAAGGAVADTVTETFQLLGPGYTAHGVSVMVSEPVTRNLWAAVEFESGQALAAEGTAGERLPEAMAGLHAKAAMAETAALDGRVVRTGTKLRMAYRWQPVHVVTAVGPYEAFGDPGYLGFYVRQAVKWGDWLPAGLEATIDVTNLLAQGYQPFLSADGRTLYLAQSPRMLQAGLSFSF